jgi:hypothetical protein
MKRMRVTGSDNDAKGIGKSQSYLWLIITTFQPFYNAMPGGGVRFKIGAIIASPPD